MENLFRKIPVTTFKLVTWTFARKTSGEWIFIAAKSFATNTLSEVVGNQIENKLNLRMMNLSLRDFPWLKTLDVYNLLIILG